MTSQFDERLKSVARGISRRWVLRGMIGGVAGAVVAGWLAAGTTPPAEAGTPDTVPLNLEQGPQRDQSHPRFNQRHRPLGHGGPRQNQGNPRLNQRGRRFDPGNPTFNQVHPHFSQQRPTFNQTHPWFGGPKPSPHQVRPPRLNQTPKP